MLDGIGPFFWILVKLLSEPDSWYLLRNDRPFFLLRLFNILLGWFSLSLTSSKAIVIYPPGIKQQDI
jgi:hypothetical protein